VPAELRAEHVGDLAEVVADVGHAALVEDGRRDHEHARVDEPGDPHREDDVDDLEPVDAPLGLVRRADDPVLRERGVEVDHVRHHRGAEDPDGQQHALRALEARHEPVRDVPRRRLREEDLGRGRRPRSRR
jgi:hypothetical protein